MNTAELIVEWQADQGLWLIYSGSVDTARNLEDWAQEQAELSAVSLQLSSRNYATHWVSLPGVKGRNLARALPFALEETLIGDIADYTVIPGASIKGSHKAYVIETDLIDRLIELLTLHHVRLTSLVPETATLDTNQMIRHSDGWLIVVDPVFEGLVPEAAVSTVFDTLTETGSLGAFSLVTATIDEGNLIKTTLSSGYADAFEALTVSTALPLRRESKVNLLQGRVIAAHQEQRPAAWWRGIVSYAAVFTLAACGYLLVANYQLNHKVAEVTDNSRNLYKQWFPGESASNFEARFRRKLRSGDDTTSGTGFDAVMVNVAHAWSEASKASVEVQSIRYSERMGEFLLDVTAKEQGDLQAFKQAIEGRGLTAEISSATADKGAIKGRVKVSGGAA